MKKLLILLIFVFVCGSFFEVRTDAKISSGKETSTEKELRGVLCDIENKNFTNAQKTLEKILQKEPNNIFAQRLLPGVLAKQIKENDKSPVNTAKIKIAIETFEIASMNPEVSIEQSLINNFIISLIQMLNDEQIESEFLKRSENKNQNPQIRSKYYTALAARKHVCANNISESVKKVANVNGQEIYVFSKPQKAEDFEKLKNCTEKGLEFIEKAIELNAESDTTWSYKGSLLIQKMRIAEMEGKTAEKENLKIETDSVIKKFRTLSDKRFQDSDKPTEYVEKKTPVNELIEELKVYRIEKPVSELITEIYIPSEMNLIAPIDDSTEKNVEDLKQNQKSKWKILSPEKDEFSAELPENVEDFLSSDGITTYTAKDGKLDFMILSQPKPSAQIPSFNDAVLNTMARSIVIPTANLSFAANQIGNFEAKLVRKENFKGFPARFYSYENNSCSGKTEGIILLLIGKTRNFGIKIDGANEKSPQVQQFLKSWKITDK